MQLKRIQHYLDKYRAFLTSREATENLYIWESQRHFQENWDLEASDLAAMYDASLENSRTRRLWKRENFEPKRLMLLFIGEQPDFVRSMFRDLFDEQKSIDGRMGRFIFYCDELLRAYKEAHPASIENNHYHGNYHMVSMYLAFRYPDQYTLYHFDGFRTLLAKLGVADLPSADDPERFFKVMRTLYTLMKKDEVLMDRHRQRLDPARHYTEDSLLLAYDFYRFTGRQP